MHVPCGTPHSCSNRLGREEKTSCFDKRGGGAVNILPSIDGGGDGEREREREKKELLKEGGPDGKERERERKHKGRGEREPWNSKSELRGWRQRGQKKKLFSLFSQEAH